MLKRIKKDKTGASLFGSENVSAGGYDCPASFIIGLPGETKDTLQESESSRKVRKLFTAIIFWRLSRYNCKRKNSGLRSGILTDNWSLYDANDAVVKTSALLPQDMRDFGARYDEEWRLVGAKSCKLPRRHNTRG